MLDRQTHKEILRAIITLCWLSLVWFWFLKYFCGEVFLAMTDNENFVKVSVAISETWLKYPVSLVTGSIFSYMQMCAITQQLYFKGKRNVVILLLILSMGIVSNFVPATFIHMPFWYGYLVLVIVGFAFNKGKKKLFGVLAVVLGILFTSISMMLRDVELSMCTDYLTMLILIFDIYIMTALYYLYSYLGGTHGITTIHGVAK